MAKDAGGHGSEARGGGGAPVVPGYTSKGAQLLQGVMARSNNPPIVGIPAHGTGVDQVGKLAPEGANSRELRLFADNDANLHRQSMQPIRDNLGKKMDKGVYDSAKAQTLWKYHADRAAQAYGEQHGSGAASGKQMFSPADRREAAANWERDERSDIKSGSSRTYKPEASFSPGRAGTQTFNRAAPVARQKTRPI
jgi:hypothetical protein